MIGENVFEITKAKENYMNYNRDNINLMSLSDAYMRQ